ncbi:unnamed protein product [Colias eurytheme]|nr:unnamed protein product [Colias eurytheme]
MSRNSMAATRASSSSVGSQDAEAQNDNNETPAPWKFTSLHGIAPRLTSPGVLNNSLFEETCASGACRNMSAASAGAVAGTDACFGDYAHLTRRANQHALDAYNLPSTSRSASSIRSCADAPTGPHCTLGAHAHAARLRRERPERAERAERPERPERPERLPPPDKDTHLTAVASTPITEGHSSCAGALCTSISSPELHSTAKNESGGTLLTAAAHSPRNAHAHSESSSDTGDLMFSELDGFVDDTNVNHIEENSNEENDVDEETMSGENDIEGAMGTMGSNSNEADILSRLLCAVHGRGVTPAGSDGSAPTHAHTHVPRNDDPQLSTAAHTDMLLLNLMKINGLTPKCTRPRHSPKRNWSSRSTSVEEMSGRRGVCAGRSRAPRARRSHALSPIALAPLDPLEPGQLPPAPVSERVVGSPAPHDYWAPDLSDNDDVEVILDYNDTLFDMLLNSLSLEGGGPGAEAPPVAPWSPARSPAAEPPQPPQHPPAARD